jgi:hypothetical protein
VHPLWQHQGIVDPMMELPYPISRDLFTQLMVVDISVDFLGDYVGPAPFSAMRPPLVGHLLTRMISGPLALLQ